MLITNIIFRLLVFFFYVFNTQCIQVIEDNYAKKRAMIEHEFSMFFFTKAVNSRHLLENQLSLMCNLYVNDGMHCKNFDFRNV